MTGAKKIATYLWGTTIDKNHVAINIKSGWWYTVPTPLKNVEFVSWDDDIPNWMEK